MFGDTTYANCCTDLTPLRLSPRIDALSRTGGGLSASSVPLSLTGANFYDAAFFGPDARSFPHAVQTSSWPLTDVFGGWVGRASGGPFCRFGVGEPVPATWISTTEVRCNMVPSSEAPGTVVVELSLNGAEGTYTDSGRLFTYYDSSAPPVIHYLEPLSVPLGGGTRLRVHGSNFRDVPNGLCTFAVSGVETSTPAQFVTHGEVACDTPPVTAAGYASVTYDAGSGGAVAVSEGVALFYSETRADASTLQTGLCDWTAATGEDCIMSVVAGSVATFTISARLGTGTPVVPDGDVFYVEAVPQGVLYDHNRVSGSFQTLEIDDILLCSRLQGTWSFANYVCTGAAAGSNPDSQGACVREGGEWVGVGEGTCAGVGEDACLDIGGVWGGDGDRTCTDTDGEAVSITAERCTAFGDTWIPPVCNGTEGRVDVVDMTECLETGLSWHEAVAPRCSSSEAVLQPWFDPTKQDPMPTTATACITNGRRWLQLPRPERCITSDGEVIHGPTTQQECEAQPCKTLGLFQACGYTDNATCIPDGVPCGSLSRTWYNDTRTHACFVVSTGARVEANDELECQGKMLFDPPIPGECRNSDGDLTDATDSNTCINTQYTWSPGRCEGLQASITMDIRGLYSLEVTAGGEAIAGSPKSITVSGVSRGDSCTIRSHDCSFNSTALPPVFSFEILSVDQQGRSADAATHTVVAKIGSIVALGLEFIDGNAKFEGALTHDARGPTAALLDVSTGAGLNITAKYRNARGRRMDAAIHCAAAEARCEARDCVITGENEIVEPSNSLVNGPVVGENVETCPLALECDALEPRGAYGMCDGACVPHEAAICAIGHILSHQDSCGLVCTESDTASYTLSGTQPYCFSGKILNPPDNIRCTPDPCTIQGIVVPANAQISESCADGNMLPDGSQLCFAKCNEGYYPSDHSVQPRCVVGHFFPGSVECLPYPCEISGIYAPPNGRKASALSVVEQNSVDSPCMGNDGVLTAAEQAAGIGSYRPICNCNEGYTLQHGQSCALSCNAGYSLVGEQPSCSVGQLNKGSVECVPNDCPVSGLSAPQNGQLDASCANGGVLAHGSSCSLTCDSGYTLAGRQPSCFAGSLDVGTATCLPNMCTVPVVSVPAKAVLGGACREGNILPHGSSCNIACTSGYVLAGDQPSCAAGVFDAGSVSCVPDFSILWLDREGFLFKASLEGTDPEVLVDTAAGSRDTVFCSFLPGFKSCGDRACVPQYQSCRGSCSDVVDGEIACDDGTCITPSQRCTAGDSKGWCQDCIARGIGLAVDNARGHVYWTDPGARVIRWASLGSSDSGGVLSGAIQTGRGADVRDIAVVDGQVFWTCADLQNCGAVAAAGGTAVAESCIAADTEVCGSATSAGAEACIAAARCEYTPYADAACVATAALACDDVRMPSDASTCQAAGACIYTPASDGVAESCRASASQSCAGVQNFNRTKCEDHRPSWWVPEGGPCTYVPVREPTCTALDDKLCSNVALGGFIDTTRAACYAAGDCVYRPSSASAGVVMASEGNLIDLGFSDTAFALAVNDAADEVFWSGLPSQHTCADLTDITTCDDGGCAAEAEHCTGNMPDIGLRSVLRASVAADTVCDAVELSGTEVDNAAACQRSGNCEYVAAAAEVLEDCEAVDAAACAAASGGTEQSCVGAAESASCTFAPATDGTCTAAAASVCDGVSLPTDQPTCEGEGDCSYLAEDPARGVAESCVAAHNSTCRALDTDQTSCEQNTDCTYNPAQPSICAASDAGACSGVDFGIGAHTAQWGRNLCEGAGACSYTAYEAEVLEDCIAPTPGAVVREGRSAVLHVPTTRASSVIYSSAHETLYWSDWHSNSIFSQPRASADSAVPTEIVAGAAGGAADLAIDQESGWLYWTSEEDDSIKRICVGTSSGAQCPRASGTASIGDSDVVVTGVQAASLAVFRPVLSCPFTEISRRSPPCDAVLGHHNVAADCAADIDGCRSVVCDYCTQANNFDATGCPGWRVHLGCSETTLVTAEGEGCIFPAAADVVNATMTSCEDMMAFAVTMIALGEFSESTDQDRARYPWCYTASSSSLGGDWIHAAEAAGAWGWCYDRVGDPCSAASACTSCGALSWAGHPDQRCHWCESAHTCAPTAEYCAIAESEYETIERPHQYVHLHEAPGDAPSSSPALIASERAWKPVPAKVLPSMSRMRDQCPDFYFYEHDYASDVVNDPNLQYLVPPTSDEAAAERWKRDGWFDFSVPATASRDVAAWCEASESGYGLVRQVDRLRPCTKGRVIPHSPTVCVGTVGQRCTFLCMAGFSPVGNHICHADGVFRGGMCA